MMSFNQKYFKLDSFILKNIKMRKDLIYIRFDYFIFKTRDYIHFIIKLIL